MGAPMTSFGDMADTRRALLRTTFLRICDLAIEREAHLLLCAGDLFDGTRPEEVEIACAREGFGKLKRAGIPAFAVPGGHDGSGTAENVLQQYAFAGLQVLGIKGADAPVSLPIDGQMIHLYGLASLPGVSTDLSVLARNSMPGFHVGLLHASVIEKGSLDIPDRDIPVTADQLAALNLDYIALGHYHDFQMIATAQKTVGCYPGTPEAKRFSETGPRSVALVTLTEHGLHIEPVEVGQTQVHKMDLDVSDLDETDAVVRSVKNLGGEGRIARITLKGLRQSILDVDEIAEKAGNAFLQLQVIDDTEVAGNADVRSIAGEPTVRGLAAATLLKKLDAAESKSDKRRIRMALTLMLHEFDKSKKGRAL